MAALKLQWSFYVFFMFPNSPSDISITPSRYGLDRPTYIFLWFFFLGQASSRRNSRSVSQRPFQRGGQHGLVRRCINIKIKQPSNVIGRPTGTLSFRFPRVIYDSKTNRNPVHCVGPPCLPGSSRENTVLKCLLVDWKNRVQLRMCPCPAMMITYRKNKKKRRGTRHFIYYVGSWLFRVEYRFKTKNITCSIHFR